MDSIVNSLPEYIREYRDAHLFIAMIDQCTKDIITPPRMYHRQASKAVPGKRPLTYRNKARKEMGTVLEDYCYNAMVFLTEGTGILNICNWLDLDYNWLRLQILRWLTDAGITNDIGRMTYSEFYYK